jgi:putative colanic acid biosynthesis UDP-glucose lipid carrier transferase
MVSQRSIGIRSLTLLWQLVLVSLSYWVWLFIWQMELFGNRLILERYLLYNEFLLVGILFGSGARRDPSHRHDWVVANQRSVRQALLGLFSVFLVVFALQDTSVSRSFFFSYVVWLFLTLLYCNYFLPRALGKWAFSGYREERVALVGTVEQAVRLRPWLERKALVGLRTIGLICPPTDSPVTPPFPVLGTIENLGEILRQHTISQTIVMRLVPGEDWLRQVTQLCESAAVRLLVLHDLDGYFNHPTTIFEDDGVRFVCLREEPLESPLNRFMKRLLDLAVALPIVIFVLPFSTFLVWLLQRFQSPGPVFFKQMRTGIMGRPFMIYKYRTMHLNHGSEARQASVDDPRIFPAGHWLRRLSIDELPQFINVLQGDMSVVGPRPHLPKHEEIFIRVMRRYLIRKFIRPGITGWAQVNGFRGEIHVERDIQLRVEADIHYLENWAFSLDCLIILKTIRHCLFPPRSAY